MPFKWANISYRLCSKFSQFYLLSGIPLGAMVFMPQALAKIQVGPAPLKNVSGYTANSGVINSGGTASQTPLIGQGGTFYYFVLNNGVNTLDPTKAFTLFNPIDLTKSAYQSSESKLPNAVSLTFYSDINPTIPTGQQPIIKVQLNQPTGSTTVKYAPIAGVNGTPCNDTICQARVDTGAGAVYYAVRYPILRQTPTINLYPFDLCSYTFQGGNIPASPPQGCQSAASGPTGNLIAPAAKTPTVLSVVFSVFLIQNTNAYSDIAANTAVADTNSGTPINLSFGIDSPTFVCAAAGDALNSNSYKPSDSQILLNTTNFTITGGSAPAGYITVAAVQDPAQTGKRPVVDSNFLKGGNTNVQTVNYGAPGQPVPGFVNSASATNRNLYNVSFNIQDKAGVFAFPTDVTSCLLNGVETVADQGFTKTGSGNCFIATAAFQSAESTPVLLLKKFRDQVLLQLSWGKAFVHWYYSWSPPAAQWLNEHPVVRVPVLLTLAPLEGAAWLILHPWIWVLCFVTSLTGGLYWMKTLARKNPR